MQGSNHPIFRDSGAGGEQWCQILRIPLSVGRCMYFLLERSHAPKSLELGSCNQYTTPQPPFLQPFSLPPHPPSPCDASDIGRTIAPQDHVNLVTCTSAHITKIRWQLCLNMGSDYSLTCMTV